MHKNSSRYKLFILLIFTASNTNHLLIKIFIKNIDKKKKVLELLLIKITPVFFDPLFKYLM